MKKINVKVNKKVLFLILTLSCIAVMLLNSSSTVIRAIKGTKYNLDGFNYSTKVVRIADTDTMDSYEEFMTENGRISGRYNGRVWTDKSVFSYDEYPDGVSIDDGKFKIKFNEGDKNEDFLTVFSALGSSQTVHSKVVVPIDVVLIIDVSSSMGSGEEKSSRITRTLQAADNAIVQLMTTNPSARVGIVLFDDNAFVLAPLKHYDPLPNKSTDTNTDKSSIEYQYIKATGTTGDLTITFKYSDGGREKDLTQKTDSGTNLQAGFFIGLKMLEDEQDTTAVVNGQKVDRVPSVICFTDGESGEVGDWSTWWQPGMGLDTQSTDQNENWHGTQNISSVTRTMKNMMTAAYMKKAVGRHYAYEPAIYTIGFELTSIRAKIALNPARYLVENPSMISGISEEDAKVVETCYQIWEDYKEGENPRFFQKNPDRHSTSQNKEVRT